MVATNSTCPRYIYMPWSDLEPPKYRAQQAVEHARVLAAQTNRPIVGVASTKDELPDDWGRLPYRTRKSSINSVRGPAVEIHFWPFIDDLAAISPRRAVHAFVLEWSSGELGGWARHNHALHFDTGAELGPTLSHEARELYERIALNGNNGWHDEYGKRDALRDLRRLREMDELDPMDLAGYMIGHHSNGAIRKLLELARKV